MSLRDEVIQEAVKESIVKNAISKMNKRFGEQMYDMRHPYWREELKEFVESRKRSAPMTEPETPQTSQSYYEKKLKKASDEATDTRGTE